MAGTIPFSSYLASLPTASAPMGANDTFPVLQGGAVKNLNSQNVAPTVLVDATSTPNIVLPVSGEITYIKTDASNTPVGFQPTVIGQTMCLELQNGLANQNESIRVKLIGENWYKVG